MNTKNTNQEGGDKQTSNYESILNMVMNVVKGFFNQFADQVKRDISKKVEDTTWEMKRMSASLLLLLLGASLFLVGFSLLLDEIVGIKGVGFLITGLVILLAGMVVFFLGKRR